MGGRTVKFFMDGVIESHTAAMLTPYSDDPKLTGSLLWDPEIYKNAVADLDKRGPADIHARHRRSRRTPDTGRLRQRRKQSGTKDRRRRIEHIETITAATFRALRQAWGDCKLPASARVSG